MIVIRRVAVAFMVSALGLAGAGAASDAVARPAAAVVASAPSSPGMFVGVTPTRLLDTRAGLGGPRLAARGTGLLQVTGRGPVPNIDISAVVLSVTVVSPTRAGRLTVYPYAAAPPSLSALDFGTRTVANLVTVPVGQGGAVAFGNVSTAGIDLLADVEGYYVNGAAHDPGGFTPTTPSLVLDTAAGRGGSAPAARGTVDLQVAGVGPVPADVSAVVLNVKVFAATRPGYLTAYPAGTPRPATSTLNFTAGETRANQATVPVGPGGRIAFYNGTDGTTQVSAAVVGWMLGGVPRDAGAFVPVTPARVLDTRNGLGAKQPGPRGTAAFTVAGRGGVPATGVGAVALNVTATAPTAPGYLTVFPGASTRPVVSTLNFQAGQTLAVAATTRLGSDGRIDVYDGSSGTTQMVVDVAGYYLAGPTTEVAPNVPGAPDLTPALQAASSAGCGHYLGRLDPDLAVSAWVSDPNGPVDRVRADFRLRDNGPDTGVYGGSGTEVVGFGDPRGQSASVTGSGASAGVALPAALLVDGHCYSIDVRADDGTSVGPVSAVRSFVYDATAPTVDLHVGSGPYRVGQPIAVTFDGTDPQNGTGRPSGLDHFAFSTTPGVVDTDGGAHYGDGDSVLLTYDTPGHYTVYTIAVDRAGNRSPVTTREFDVTG